MYPDCHCNTYKIKHVFKCRIAPGHFMVSVMWNIWSLVSVLDEQAESFTNRNSSYYLSFLYIYIYMYMQHDK